MKNIIKIFKKITILSFIFFFVLNFSANIVNSWWIFGEEKQEKKENVENFKSIENLGLNEVGVAFSINVGTKFYEKSSGQEEVEYFNDIVSISTLNSDSEASNDLLIRKNMDALKDYKNILKINVKSYLDSGENRKETYDSLINQLKIRYNYGKINIKNLTYQIEIIEKKLSLLQTSIDNIKKNMENNLKSYNYKGLSKNMENYLSIKQQQNNLSLYHFLCKRFLSHYNFLNLYNQDLLNTLLLNEDIIVKNSFLIIPSSGTKILEDLNLLYDERTLLDKAKNIKNSTIKIGEKSVNYIKDKTDNSDFINSMKQDAKSYYENLESSSKNHYDNITSNSSGNRKEKLWLFGDPFGLEGSNGSIPVFKADGGMNFGQ